MLGFAAIVILALLGLGTIGMLAGRSPDLSRVVVYGASGILALALFVMALSYLLGAGQPVGMVLPLGLPWLQAHLRLDSLSAYFLLIVNLIGGLAAIYGLGYGRHEDEPHRVLPFFPVFLAGMNLVPLADDAFVFLVAWEAMSLASWLLVLTSHRRPETRHAAYVYLIMAAVGTAALLLAFGTMAGSAGDYNFAAIRERQLAPGFAALVLFFLILGAGSKAGLVPLHAWLPLAHPAAPSHISALMSGVMTKVAIYAMIRVLFDLVDQPQWWWGAVLLGFGAATSLIGILFAQVQRDLKTMLAYSTVENVGVIVVGIGLALAFKTNGMVALAGLSLGAALLHVLNHAVFKSLLFFGAGAVLVATGERDMERLGGLIHRMPYSAFAFLVGCAAISALPPLNGFVSEWMTFQAILAGPQLPQWELKFIIPVVGVMLALSAALAAACFVRAFGICFLGRPRSSQASDAKEVDRDSYGVMLLLALLAALIGALPAGALALIDPVAQMVIGAPAMPAPGMSWLWLEPLTERGASYSGLIVLLVLVVLGVVLVYVMRRLAAATMRRSAIWDCGFPDPRPATQYTASSFGQPIRRVFGTTVFRAREYVDMPEPGEMRPASFTVVVRDLIWEWAYQPVQVVVDWSTERFNILQFLTIRRYLTLMFGALVVLLAVVAVTQ